MLLGRFEGRIRPPLVLIKIDLAETKLMFNLQGCIQQVQANLCYYKLFNGERGIRTLGWT